MSYDISWGYFGTMTSRDITILWDIAVLYLNHECMWYSLLTGFPGDEVLSFAPNLQSQVYQMLLWEVKWRFCRINIADIFTEAVMLHSVHEVRWNKRRLSL